MSVEHSKGLYISSDIGLGLPPAGQIEYLTRVYRHVPFVGIELLAEKEVPALHQRALSAEKFGYQYYFHGQTGGVGKNVIDQTKLVFANGLLIPTIELISNFKGNEFLFHSPEVDHHIQMLLLAKESIKHLWVENHCGGKKALDDAIKTVLLLRELGFAQVGLMIDWAHLMEVEKLLKSTKFEYSNIFNKSLAYVAKKVLNKKDACGQGIWAGSHLPYGTDLTDSLDKSKLDDSHYRAHGQLHKAAGIAHFVLESQHGAIHSLRLKEREESKLQKEHLDTYEKLSKHGVVY